MVTPGPFKLMTPNVFCQSILSMRKSLYSYGFGSLYWPLSHSLTLSSTWCEYNIRIHQIFSPIYKSGSTNFLKEYFFWFLFQLVNWEKKTVFMTNKKFVSFFNGSNWEKFVEKIRETNWWKHLMNSLQNRKFTFYILIQYVSNYKIDKLIQQLNMNLHEFVYQFVLHAYVSGVLAWRLTFWLANRPPG